MTKENVIDAALDEKLNAFFPEEKEIAEEEVEEIKEEVEKTQEPENKEEVEQVEEEAEEEAEEKETTEEEDNSKLDRQLSGQPKEFKELVKSVKDPELQAKILEAGKVVRAREDKVRLENGNLKKEYGNFSGLIKMIDENPAEAIKHIAKVTKIDLNNLVAPVEDEYDYRTPEEIAKDKKLADIERKLAEFENQKVNDELTTIRGEIEIFANSEDDDGELKYPYFEKLESSIYDILGLEKQKLGAPKTAAERKERLEKAYQKAVLLDDDLRAKRDEDILKKASIKKQAEIEKAKKLKKFSRPSTNQAKPTSEKEVISQLYDKLFAN